VRRLTSWACRKARGITRDLKWGVPVPDGVEGLNYEEYKNKV
jgi:methionyl-tRNA synthetase